MRQIGIISVASTYQMGCLNHQLSNKNDENFRLWRKDVFFSSAAAQITIAVLGRANF